MIRHSVWLLLFALAAASAGAADKPSPAPVPALSQDQARAVLDTLNDPKKRAAFAATLEALVRSLPAPPPAPAGPAPETHTTVEGIVIPLAPDSLGAQVLLTASGFVNEIGNDAVQAFQTIQSLPLLWGWAVVMATNPLGQGMLLDAGRGLAATLAIAAVVYLALRHLLRRPKERLRARTEEPPLADAETRAEIGDIEGPIRPRTPRIVGQRVRGGLVWLGLDLAPVLGILIAGHLVAASALGGREVGRLVSLAVIDAIVVSLTLLAMTRALLDPDPPGMGFFRMPRAVAHYLMLWGRRLILIAVPGYTIGEVGLLLGLSNQAHDALQKAVGFVLLLSIAYVSLHRRRIVRHWLSAPPGADSGFARFRDRLAGVWHWIMLFFLGALWLSWALRAPGAIGRTLWYVGATGAVLVGAGLARMAARGLIRGFEPGANDTAEFSIRARLNTYHAMVHALARLAITVIALLTLLQVYGLGGLTWLLTSDVGHRVLSGLGTLAVTIGLAFAVWEVVNIAVQRHLETLRRDAQAARSARLRTLLPLVRTALAITIVVVAGLMVLSEIGVNIAPLLAGAGIVGVAIGFGSQKLVQDVITGVFLLLENTVQVGDIVKVGDQAGLVESLSVRTIRLRTEDGSVVVIPFSAVTTVINMTRDFSRAVISVSVGMNEDVDRVVDAMRGIVREMRDEEAWCAVILDDLEVWGLDKFMDSAMLIKCRIMCVPTGRWPVGREFNRRMKQRFEALGIDMPYPHLKLVMDAPVGGRVAAVSLEAG